MSSSEKIAIVIVSLPFLIFAYKMIKMHLHYRRLNNELDYIRESGDLKMYKRFLIANNLKSKILDDDD